MNLVNYGSDLNAIDQYFLNMDFIETVAKQGDKYRVWMIGCEDGYEISEKAYNTILKYGKAEI